MMRWSACFMIGLLVAMQLVVIPSRAQESSTPEDSDDSVIRAAAEAYVKAFNAKDAVAISQLFTPNAEISSGDKLLKGREAIQADFIEQFKSEVLPQLELADVSIDVISPAVAIETGTAILTTGEFIEAVTYRAVHIKSDSGWLVDRVQDDDPIDSPPSNYDRLKVLEWMVGTWALQREGSTLDVSCRWTTNQNFLLQSYAITGENGVEFEGTHLVGWDPIRQQIRSWLFDSDGGFGSGVWTGESDRWSVQTIQVTPDGKEATATNIYRRIDDNTTEYKSIGRQVGGQLLENVPPTQFVRQ